MQILAISGSGPRGHIVSADVEAAVAAAKAKPGDSLPSSKPMAPSDDQVLKLSSRTLRNRAARHDAADDRAPTGRSEEPIPHFYLTLDCALDALLALRAQLNAAAPRRVNEKGEAPSYKLSVNDMVIKALALALRDLPDANVSWTDAGMLRHRHADVGVAVSIPGGLITPIIRKARGEDALGDFERNAGFGRQGAEPQVEA